MKKNAMLIILVILQCASISLHAHELKRSAKTDSWENPFIAYGYNPKTRITTGYLAALRISPGRTDECKLVFAGDIDKSHNFFVKYTAETGTNGSQEPPRRSVSLFGRQDASEFKFIKKDMGGDCDWVLPFVVESEVPENPDEVIVAMDAKNVGDWVSVYVIRAKKAQFYSQPDSSTAKKAFLVKGDVIYVYEEQPEWYFVKYDNGKRKTEGWIKRSDTLQP